MPLTNFPQGITSFGSPVMPFGGPFLPHIPRSPGANAGGKVYFVDATNGTAGTDGESKETALSTIQAAIAKCVNNAGDTIMVFPGTYAENLTITSLSGVSIMAAQRYGNTGRPSVAPATGTALAITGSQRISVFGLKFSGVAAGKWGLTTDSRGGLFYDCEFTADTTGGFLLKPDATASTTNDASQNRIVYSVFQGSGGVGLRFESTATSAANPVECQVVGCLFYNNTGIDIDDLDTGVTNKTLVRDEILGCSFLTRNKATYIQANTGSSNANNLVAGNYFNVSTPLTPTHVKLTNNSEFAGNFPDAGIGTTFSQKYTITSSAILSASATDITAVSAGGELLIEDVVVKTDGTGLAGGTNFQILSNNAKGLANVFVETVANLGANKTVDLTGASVTKIRTVLESGKKLQQQSTVAPCTGTGTIDVYFKFRRLAPLAYVA